MPGSWPTIAMRQSSALCFEIADDRLHAPLGASDSMLTRGDADRVGGDQFRGLTRADQRVRARRRSITLEAHETARPLRRSDFPLPVTPLAVVGATRRRDPRPDRGE